MFKQTSQFNMQCTLPKSLGYYGNDKSMHCLVLLTILTSKTDTKNETNNLACE